MPFVKSLTLLSVTSVTLLSAPPAGASVPPAEEQPTAQRRLAVAPTDRSDLLVVDASTGETVTTLALAAPVTYASALTEDGRFLLAAHDDGVSVIDGGVWSAGHGDHSHHYAAPPRVVGSVPGERPSHLISHEGVSSLWFDGLGEAVVIDESSLADGDLSVVGSVGDAEPHHGFAVPADDGRFVVSALAESDDGLPDSITVVDAMGVVLATFECTDTHGEAAFGNGSYGAACADGILLLTDDGDEWTAELVGYADTDDVDPYGFGDARAWAIAVGGGVAHGVGAFGTSHLFVLDPATAELATFDLGAQIATFGVQPLGAARGVLVLTTDGDLHLVNTFDGSIASTVAVLDPFEEGDDFDIAYHQLVVGGTSAYVSDPRNDAVVRVGIGEELSLEAAFELGVEPAYLDVFNG